MVPLIFRNSLVVEIAECSRMNTTSPRVDPPSSDVPSKSPKAQPTETLLRGSWGFVCRVISKVTIVISTYNPN